MFDVVLCCLLLLFSFQIRIKSNSGNKKGFRNGTLKEAQFDGPWDLGLDNKGNLVVCEMYGCRIRRIDLQAGTVSTVAGSQLGYKDGSRTSAMFNNPHSIAICPDGSIYVTDQSNYVLRKILVHGEVLTVSGKPNVEGCRDGSGESARSVCTFNVFCRFPEFSSRFLTQVQPARFVDLLSSRHTHAYRHHEPPYLHHLYYPGRIL